MNVSREDVIVSALSCLLAEKLAESEDFSLCEKQGLEKTLELFCTAYARALEALDDAIFDEKDPCFTSSGKEKRHILSTAGLVSINRRRYRSDSGSVYLLDEAIDLPSRTKVSPQLSHLAAKFALGTSYSEAAHALEYYISANLSKMTIARILEQNVALLDERQTLKDSGKVTVPVLDVEADGCYVPLQRSKAQKAADRRAGKKRARAYKEVGMFSAYAGKEIASEKTGRKRRIDALHFATVSDPKDAWSNFSSLLRQKYDTSHIFYSNLACDGDPSYTGGAKYLPGSVSLGYDLHHISPKIAAHLGRDIAREVYATMKGLGFSAGFDVLVTYIEHFLEESGDEKYSELLAFAHKHRQSMKTAFDYNLGTIEGTIAHIIGSRCKRFGGGWGPRLEAVVRLRAARASEIEPKLATRKRDISLPEIVCRRKRVDIESYIAALEQRARKNQTVKSLRKSLEPEYYHQAPIAHRSKDERCHSLLRKWA